jgi:hypothetical protein
MAMLGCEPFVEHPVALNALPDDRMLTGNGCVSRQLKLALVGTRKGLREKIPNRGNNMTRPIVPRIQRRLRVGTASRKGKEKKKERKKENDTAGKLKAKFYKTLGNLSMVVKQITEVTYMTESLVVPGKIRKLHIDDLEPCVRRIIHIKLFKQTRSDL